MCAWVAQSFVRTLSSKSSTVKLFKTKNLSLCMVPPLGEGVTVSDSGVATGGEAVVVSLSSFPSVLASSSRTFVACNPPGACGADDAGPVGATTPAGPSTVLFRSLHTKRTVKNLES